MSHNPRTVSIGAEIAPSKYPQPKPLNLRKIDDYPDMPGVYLTVAQRYSSPLLVGPPLCDELIALIQHMFTEEEAELVQHLKLPTGKTATALSSAVHRPLAEVQPILDRLADEKHILLSFGEGAKKRYGLMPIVPGVFESVLIRTSLDTLTPWHRRFAELFADLYDTGYLVEYAQHPVPSVRYLPVNQSIENHSMALPSDKLAEVLDRYQVFAVGLCQCRMTEQIVGRSCDGALENCVGFGDGAEYGLRSGRMRRAEKQEVLEIKAEAEARGLVTFMAEIDTGKIAGGASCSCCSCCCHALRTVSQFNRPGLIAPPHFMPVVDASRCNHCGKCARACPMEALVVERKTKTFRHLAERCIGCGLCAVACDRQRAIEMEPTAGYRRPPRRLTSIFSQMIPNYLRNAWSVWRKFR